MKTLLLTAFALICLCATANAQQTFFRVRIDNVAEAFTYPSSGVFNTPEDSTNAGPLGPGAAYEFTFDAPPGASLSFATMFVPSNDLFFAPDENGVALWNPDGTQVSGDVTAQVLLWDAGTEENEEPGVGPNQVMRQGPANTGPDDPDATVRLVNDAFTYPAVSDVIRVIIEAIGPTAIEGQDPVPNRFTLHQNYPNPFNPETTIAFDLHQAAPVRLTVYNILGQQVANLVDGFRSAGTHQVQWNGRDSRGFRAATGIYLYKLDVGGSTAVRKMVLLQ